MSDFDWSDKDSIVVENVDAIAVYRNPDDDVVIRRQDTPDIGDAYVVIPLGHLPAIIAALQALEK